MFSCQIVMGCLTNGQLEQRDLLHLLLSIPIVVIGLLISPWWGQLDDYSCTVWVYAICSLWEKSFYSILFISHSYTMSSGVGQLRSPIHTKRKKFVWGHRNTIHVQFGFNEVSSFWEKNICFPLVFYDKTWSSHGSNLGFQIDSKIKPQTFARQERHPRKILAKFAVVWLSGLW